METVFESIRTREYVTDGGIRIRRLSEPLALDTATTSVLAAIDDNKGALFSSSFEFPGRYSRWDIGFVNPCLEFKGFGRHFTIRTEQSRCTPLLMAIVKVLQSSEAISIGHVTQTEVIGIVENADNMEVREDLRTRQPSIFTVIRLIMQQFHSDEDSFLGLYGAFGFDLAFQLESITQKIARDPSQPDLVLYLPDDLIVVDHPRQLAYRHHYEFLVDAMEQAHSTNSRTDDSVPFGGSRQKAMTHPAPPYVALVKEAKKAFQAGDLFEVVPTQTFIRSHRTTPVATFERLKQINPSPYGFILNLGQEHLVGASPEMFVRVEGRKAETCPISGTIKRGRNAMEDADNIKELLNSSKDEAELTMCTDVDRNDKSRICVPGSVRIIGRRQIELYSHLIHTVDHIEGQLEDGFDGIDALMTHMWAVTVTGAPKRAAMQWIENHETTPRDWYGGAVGYLAFNGDVNTGLTLRTIRFRGTDAEIRVGATLLYDSVPADEEQETITKAAALIAALHGHDREPAPKRSQSTIRIQRKTSVLMVDHEDSFVHTLASYFRLTGAMVDVFRPELARRALIEQKHLYELVVLSPGPGKPIDFEINKTLELCMNQGLPVFGVCLGMQAMVEYFGGALQELDVPQHGKKSAVSRVPMHQGLFDGVSETFTVGRYHSLYAATMPDSLHITATSDDDVVMAIEHANLPFWGVQFHPESVMSSQEDVGMQIIQNVIQKLATRTTRNILSV